MPYLIYIAIKKVSRLINTVLPLQPQVQSNCNSWMLLQSMQWEAELYRLNNEETPVKTSTACIRRETYQESISVCLRMKTSWQRLLRPRGQNTSQRKKRKKTQKGKKKKREKNTLWVDFVPYLTFCSKKERGPIFRSTNVTGSTYWVWMQSFQFNMVHYWGWKHVSLLHGVCTLFKEAVLQEGKRAYFSSLYEMATNGSKWHKWKTKCSYFR